MKRISRTPSVTAAARRLRRRIPPVDFPDGDVQFFAPRFAPKFTRCIGCGRDIGTGRSVFRWKGGPRNGWRYVHAHCVGRWWRRFRSSERERLLRLYVGAVGEIRRRVNGKKPRQSLVGILGVIERLDHDVLGGLDKDGILEVAAYGP